MLLIKLYENSYKRKNSREAFIAKSLYSTIAQNLLGVRVKVMSEVQSFCFESEYLNILSASQSRIGGTAFMRSLFLVNIPLRYVE